MPDSLADILIYLVLCAIWVAPPVVMVMGLVARKITTGQRLAISGSLSFYIIGIYLDFHPRYSRVGEDGVFWYFFMGLSTLGTGLWIRLKGDRQCRSISQAFVIVGLVFTILDGAIIYSLLHGRD